MQLIEITTGLVRVVSDRFRQAGSDPASRPLHPPFLVYINYLLQSRLSDRIKQIETLAFEDQKGRLIYSSWAGLLFEFWNDGGLYWGGAACLLKQGIAIRIKQTLAVGNLSGNTSLGSLTLSSTYLTTRMIKTPLILFINMKLNLASFVRLNPFLFKLKRKRPS